MCVSHSPISDGILKIENGIISVMATFPPRLCCSYCWWQKLHRVASCFATAWWSLEENVSILHLPGLVGGWGCPETSCYLQILSLIVHDSTDSTLLSHFVHFSTAFLGHDDSGINIKLDTCLTNFKDNAIIVSGAPEDKSKFVLVTEINLQVSCKIVRLP